MFTVCHFRPRTIKTRHSGKELTIVQRVVVCSTPSMTAACMALDLLGGVLMDEDAGIALAEDLTVEHLDLAVQWQRWQERMFGRMQQMWRRSVSEDIAGWLGRQPR